VSLPSPKSQPNEPEIAGRPLSASIGCSGQTPVSITPTLTFSAAWMLPPSDGQTACAPINVVLSSSGRRRASRWTASTPRTRRSFAIWLAGTRAATPP
jgi:hypothetical protein